LLDSELNQYIAYSDFLLRVVRDNLPKLIETIKESSAGYPSGHEGGTEVDAVTGEAVTYDSRTQSAALHPDPARDARKELERNTKALRSALVNLDGLRQAWLFTTSDRPLGEGNPGCESCARSGVWSPRHQQSSLCQWCADWSQAEGHFPPKSLLEAHHQGKRITNALLDKLGVKTKTASARDRRKAG
jgi:hypothetical protein